MWRSSGGSHWTFGSEVNVEMQTQEHVKTIGTADADSRSFREHLATGRLCKVFAPEVACWRWVEHQSTGSTFWSFLIHSRRIELAENMGSIGASCAFQCLQATMLDISGKSSDRWFAVMATYPSSVIISPFHPLSWAFTSGCCSGFQVADLQLLVRCSRHKTPVTWLPSSAEEWWQIQRSESTHQASPSCKMP